MTFISSGTTLDTKLRRIKNIVLIDDDHLENYLNEAIIRKSGIAQNIEVFHDPVTALESLNDSEVKTTPDLIFLDLTMPTLNGFDFISEYTKSNRKTDTTKLIVLTSFINEKAREKAEKEREVLEFRLKPLTVKSLKEIEKSYYAELDEK